MNMTCEDCLHYEACRNLIEKFNSEYKGKKIVRNVNITIYFGMVQDVFY